jgi:hypothetical protein
MALQKLSDQNQQEIRDRYKKGETLSKLAREFSVSVSRVHAICNNGKNVVPAFMRRKAGRPKKTAQKAEVRVEFAEDWSELETFDDEEHDLAEIRRCL